MQKVTRRYDAGRLERAERTPQGGIRAPAYLTRVGVFEYRNPDGSIRRELRPPDEVFAAESLATLRGAPVTHLHVAEIDAKNWQLHTKGHVADDSVRRDGNFVAADLVIQDARIVEMIERGELVEISLGYQAIMDETPGVWEGQPYDAVQRSIVYNHAALGPKNWGRAGSKVALRLDSRGDAIPPCAEDDGEQARLAAPEMHMDAKKFELVNGVEYEVGTAAHREAVRRRDSEEEKRDEEMQKLRDENEKLKEKLDELTEKLKDSESEREKADKKTDSLVEERARVRADLLFAAHKRGVEVRADASDDEIRRAVLAKVAPSVKLDSYDAERLAVVYDYEMSRGTQVAAPAQDPIARAVLDSRESAAKPAVSKAAQAKADYYARLTGKKTAS